MLVLLTAFPLLSSVLFVLVLGGGASQRQRDERRHRLTLLSLLLFSSCRLVLFVGWRVLCSARAALRART